MNGTVYFLIAEAAAVILFLFGCFQTAKDGKFRLLEFIMIFFYAIILEELDMRFFKSYEYGTGFALMWGQVPVSIALLWAVIVYGAMSISDASGLPDSAKPFLDALLAVWIDLALDTIAIRAGFWNWKILLSEGWFGVPAGNLYAWMWVAFFYSVFARAVRLLLERNKKWAAAYFILPFFCYALLFAQLNLIGFIARASGFSSQNQRLWIFALHILVFVIITAVNWKDRISPKIKIPGIWTVSRILIHAFFLWIGIQTGIFAALPVLAVLAVFTLIGDILFLRTL